jgi:methylmalonyl-CoA mutase N-terminal domain/subunit
VRIALRTQQIIAHESGVASSVDPLAGSYLVESWTNRLEAQAYEYFDKIEALGGVVPAIEQGFFQREIAASAYRYQREIEERRRIVIGVNEYVAEEPLSIPLLRLDPEGEDRQRARLARVRRERDNQLLQQRLDGLRQAAKGTENLMPYILDAVRAYGTLGEICDVLRVVFGEYREPLII